MRWYISNSVHVYLRGPVTTYKVVVMEKVWVCAPHVTPLPPPQFRLLMHGRMMSPVVTVLQRHVEEPPAKISKLKPGPQYPNFQLMPSHTILPMVKSRMAVVMAAA